MKQNIPDHIHHNGPGPRLLRDEYKCSKNKVQEPQGTPAFWAFPGPRETTLVTNTMGQFPWTRHLVLLLVPQGTFGLGGTLNS